VPKIIPACVIAGVVIVGDCDTFGDDPTGGSIAFARPKSSTLTVPSGRTLMFAGLRSRWMIPCSCAASRASATCFAIGSASSSGSAPFAIRWDRSSPSTSSITSAVKSGVRSSPWIAAMADAVSNESVRHQGSEPTAPVYRHEEAMITAEEFDRLADLPADCG
jgi:hypothetical protein